MKPKVDRRVFVVAQSSSNRRAERFPNHIFAADGVDSGARATNYARDGVALPVSFCGVLFFCGSRLRQCERCGLRSWISNSIADSGWRGWGRGVGVVVGDSFLGLL